MILLNRMRDALGRFLPSAQEEQPVSDVANPQTKELVTQISTEISINGKPLDLTNLTKEDAVVLYNFGVLREEHFQAICKLENWRFDEELDYEEIDEDDDEE